MFSRKRTWKWLAFIGLWLPLSSFAGVSLHLIGLEDDALIAAVQSRITLNEYANRSITRAQVRNLYRKIPKQVDHALRPYGYFDATVETKLVKQNDLEQNDQWQVEVTVDKGQPVTVDALTIDLPEKVMTSGPVRRAVKYFKPAKGHILNQAKYSQSRDRINDALHAIGYLDASMTTHRVTVTKATHSADINLAWHVGKRYHFGNTHFENSQFEPGFLDRYIPWEPGDPFVQSELLTLQQQLSQSNYFDFANITPEVEHTQDQAVPIKVDLEPAKRSVYTGGPFIGTDTGVGLRGGVDRRWVNRRGHTWKNRIIVAQRLKALDTIYTIPQAAGIHRAWHFGAKFKQEKTDSSRSRTLELVGNQTRLWHGWLVTEGLHLLSGTFTIGSHRHRPSRAPGIENHQSTLLYPEISLAKKHANNSTFTRRGWSLTLAARGSTGHVFSDAKFAQITADAKWVHAFHHRNRLIVHGSTGMTYTDNFHALHPQLRFYAGGSTSNRGYSYQQLGPKNRYDRVVGGKRLLTTSLTFEHFFTRRWGLATFIDAGNAFNGVDYNPKLSAGLGLRWVSPVGMVRLDLGVPVNDSHHHGIQFNLVMGPDL